VELREVHELLADTHLRVQASLLGHVADQPEYLALRDREREAVEGTDVAVSLAEIDQLGIVVGFPSASDRKRSLRSLR
jgi:hypothetical protein